MPERKDAHETDHRIEIAGQLASHAEELISEAEQRLHDQQEGARGLALVGIGGSLLSLGYTLNRIADASAANTRAVQRVTEDDDAAVRALLMLARDEFRDGMHANLNGGYSDDAESTAFHHGMDTVCNAIVARARPVLAPAPATCSDVSRDLAAEAVEHIGRVTDYALGGDGMRKAYVWIGGLARAANIGDAAVFDRLLAEERRPSTAAPHWLRCGCAVGHHPDRHAARAEFKDGNRCALGWNREVANKPDEETTCEDPSNWCAHHCPLETAPAPPEPGQKCGGQLPRCLDHCS